MTSRVKIHAELEGKIRSNKHEALNLGIKNESNRKKSVRINNNANLTNGGDGPSAGPNTHKKEKIYARRALKLVYHHAIVRALKATSPNYIRERAAMHKRKGGAASLNTRSLYRGTREVQRAVDCYTRKPANRPPRQPASRQVHSVSDLGKPTQSLYAFYAQFQ